MVLQIRRKDDVSTQLVAEDNGDIHVVSVRENLTKLWGNGEQLSARQS